MIGNASGDPRDGVRRQVIWTLGLGLVSHSGSKLDSSISAFVQRACASAAILCHRNTDIVLLLYWEWGFEAAVLSMNDSSLLLRYRRSERSKAKRIRCGLNSCPETPDIFWADQYYLKIG